jgi:hypothetical protein
MREALKLNQDKEHKDHKHMLIQCTEEFKQNSRPRTYEQGIQTHADTVEQTVQAHQDAQTERRFRNQEMVVDSLNEVPHVAEAKAAAKKKAEEQAESDPEDSHPKRRRGRPEGSSSSSSRARPKSLPATSSTRQPHGGRTLTIETTRTGF